MPYRDLPTTHKCISIYTHIHNAYAFAKYWEVDIYGGLRVFDSIMSFMADIEASTAIPRRRNVRKLVARGGLPRIIRDHKRRGSGESWLEAEDTKRGA